MKDQKLLEKVRELVAAPSCCPEAKAAGQALLDAAGTDKEADAVRALIAELEEDVCSVDDALAFFESETGVKFFGAERAGALAAAARKVKAEGGKYCPCPACTAGGVLLDHKEDLL